MGTRLLLLSVVLLGACKDECDWQTAPGRCEANAAVTCPEPGVDQLVPVRWATKPCGAGACVTAGTTAFCALDASVSPWCDGGSAPACDGRALVRCTLGFETAREPCLACDAGWCEGGPLARCVGDVDCAPELRCGDAGAGQYCLSR